MGSGDDVQAGGQGFGVTITDETEGGSLSTKSQGLNVFGIHGGIWLWLECRPAHKLIEIRGEGAWGSDVSVGMLVQGVAESLAADEKRTNGSEQKGTQSGGGKSQPRSETRTKPDGHFDETP